MASMNIRKNDTVEVIVGPTEGDRAVKGKRGKVILVDRENGKVMVRDSTWSSVIPAPAARRKRAVSSKNPA